MTNDGDQTPHKALGAFAALTLSASAFAAENTPSEKIFNQLGIRDAGAALEVLYHSGTLTEENLWANLKRAKIENPETIWRHQVTILQEKIAKGQYDDASKIFFGGSLGAGDKAASHEIILSPMDAKRFLVAQTQEVFGRKEGVERHDAFGVPADKEVDEAHMKAALSKLGLIDRIDPKGDENIVLIPGASVHGLIARDVYVSEMIGKAILKPDSVIITAGDRPLTEGLDSLDVTKIDTIAELHASGSSFEAKRKILLASEDREKSDIFAELQNAISKDYDARQLIYQAKIKGVDDWDKFSPLNETGASVYLINKLGIEGNWIVTHTPKYEDGRRPDTNSTASTFAKYYFDEIYKESAPNKITIAANQPYSERQAESYKRALAKEAEERKIPKSSYEVSFCGFEYNHGDAKRPLSEFAALVAEKAKNDPGLNLEGLMFRGREEVSIGDMPSLGEVASEAE